MQRPPPLGVRGVEFAREPVLLGVDIAGGKRQEITLPLGHSLGPSLQECNVAALREIREGDAFVRVTNARSLRDQPLLGG